MIASKLIPIGSYKSIIAGGPNPLYGKTPVYNTRIHYLPLIKKDVFQVLVMNLNILVWINVHPSDVELKTPAN